MFLRKEIDEMRVNFISNSEYSAVLSQQQNKKYLKQVFFLYFTIFMDFLGFIFFFIKECDTIMGSVPQRASQYSNIV
jgi:hypothetical protein